jgi:deazaflavin-dependent oxidoreductase (nitroreductase family)
MFRFMNWLAKQKALQQRVPRIFRYGGWLFVLLFQLGGVYAVLLTTTGRRSGNPHTVALAGPRLGQDYTVVTPFGPSGKYPDWYLNLKHNPKATIEIVWRKREVIAEEVLDEAERTSVLRRYGLGMMGLEGAQQRTGKKFPVIRLRVVKNS